MRPILYILSGKVGAGKSTLAKALEQKGVVRFSQDERTLSKVQDQRKPHDFLRVCDVQTLRAAEAVARGEILDLARHALLNRDSVVIDDGFWTKSQRDAYKKFAAEVGADVVLYYLPIEREEQWARLDLRNKGDLTATHYISWEDMEYLNQFFEAPEGEGEVVYR